MNLTLSLGRRALSFEGTTDEYQLHVVDLVQAFWTKPAGDVDSDDTEDEATHESSPRATSPLQMTARAVATALGGESGAELLTAAAAFLGVVESRETFSRAQLLETMKSATGYYKPSYSGNLSGYLETLCKKGVLIETSNEVYAVKASEFDGMVQRLRSAG